MSLPHDYAHTHVCGESEFVDDRPIMKNELFVDVFFSTRAHALIKRVDFTEVLKQPGVVAVFTGHDFAHNMWGTIFKDQPLLATDKVQYAGEGIALIVATSIEAAQRAKHKTIIEYTDLAPIMSIQEARKHESFIIPARTIERGNVDEEMKKAPHTLEGNIVIQGHDHFYLESQVSIAYPLEDGQIEIHSSSQHPTETQHVVAHALGLPDNDVVCQVKRMGGGFGGKESQAAPFAAMAALCAMKLKRPVRICLTKDDDMIMTGKRNPFENEYKVGFDEHGKILAMDIKLFSDAGAYADLSTSIMERAMLHSDNSYFIPHMRVVGQVCKTNHHSHTAFRGFGGPKGVATAEKIIEAIAHYLKKDPLDVRKINLYSDVDGRNTTHYGQLVENNVLDRLVNELENKSDYRKRRQEITKFNKENKDFIRGLSLTTVKFGISFTTRFLNQGNALVIVHNDGSLQIATGATEMGQGVNARIAEMVTTELGLPRTAARVMPTRTDKNANTSPTAASSGTDINGAAALLATRKIKKRLSELALKLLDIPKDKWASKTAGLGTQPEVMLDTPNLDENDPNAGAEWESGVAKYFEMEFQDGWVFHPKHLDKKIEFKYLILEAYLNRVSLSDYAFYKIPGIEFNKMTGQGDAFLYFTQGAACSEVSLDRHTGEVKVLRTDILMDLGRPVNHDLDVGQVTGAFIQGLGWVTTENLFYNDQGLLLSHAPSTYKIPNVQDIPRTFKVELLENDENYANVRGTKAVGEPPLLLALSAWTAVTNALSYLPHFQVDYPGIRIPATSENVLREIMPEKFKEWER
ncbi:xanthine dehydrogenase molybdopterin binding subunit [Peredibacter sp. HCB2-198]|uniref:xanthine dehydrogenase molybdopterin binding subunit n=1 Tax=Peredibacter sp. HCB2-198 TaxID=3383025 RepID=UPI0038B41C00